MAFAKREICVLATVLSKVQHKICFHACRKVRHAMLVFAPVDNSRLLLSMWWAEGVSVTVCANAVWHVMINTKRLSVLFITTPKYLKQLSLFLELGYKKQAQFNLPI